MKILFYFAKTKNIFQGIFPTKSFHRVFRTLNFSSKWEWVESQRMCRRSGVKPLAVYGHTDWIDGRWRAGIRTSTYSGDVTVQSTLRALVVYWKWSHLLILRSWVPIWSRTDRFFYPKLYVHTFRWKNRHVLEPRMLRFFKKF